ncbi:hypothetical protein ACH5RR_007594 [Cinchona calisaya]|uniref:RING-type domain-containing protein n=1 Tax=Cinchona calisaya TaxID=153742 RepID=A0ABD3ACQ0_9GENT
MHSDSIATNASNMPMASSNAKDFAKKKRMNRSAKLKQWKLDARREQWLSQVGIDTVKNKGRKEESTGRGIDGPLTQVGRRVRAMEKLEIRSRGEEENDGGSIHHDSDSKSPLNSPMSHTGSVLGGNDSGTNFTGSSSSSRSSSSSSSGGCCSGSMSEEDEDGEDGCLDDWEAVADALAATDEKQQLHANSLDTASEDKNVARFDSQPVSSIDISKAKPGAGASVDRTSVNCRAWRPDDAFRPQSLPNLSKQYSFPMNSDRHYACGASVWVCKNAASTPKPCPICYEDLDFTDSSFLPCSCGFRLCLFCHKRILEEDGRCPGCRKQYNYDPVEGEATLDGGSLIYRLTRSCSMITRS